MDFNLAAPSSFRVILAFTILILIVLVYDYAQNRGLPPGPPRLPLIGNLHQAPTELPWLTFQKWLKRYGPIISARFGGSTVIMVGDATIARDLLDKRGHIYSDRPRMVMAGENLTKGMHLLLRRYDERYRLHQRLEAPSLSPRASQTYFPLQDLESKQLIYDFLTRDNNFQKHFERFAGSLVYSLAYGFRLPTGDEEELKEAHMIEDHFALAARVGAWIVDALPFLNVLPRPLAPWKRTADEFYRIEKHLHLRNLERGLSSKGWNWSKAFSAAKESQTMSRVELAYDLGILADAALDTTAVVMRMFVLAALSYPRFMDTAQEELDGVVGPDRLPTLADKAQLPYIVATVEETLRWRTIVPGGIPHATTQEDSYGGYRVPKGAIVVPQMWAMCLDDTAFDRALEFQPERWLEKDEADNGSSRFSNFFGYGRRTCTGRHIARNSLFIMIARLLWAFNIRPAVDKKTGRPKAVDDMAFTSGFVSTPLPFEAVFEPRTERAREVIIREWENTEKDVDLILNSVRDEQISQRIRV